MISRIIATLLIVNVAFGQNALTSVEQDFEILVPLAELEPEVNRVPAKIIKGLLLVEGKVENRRGYFILDTGAPGLVINRVASSERLIKGRSLTKDVHLNEVLLKDVEWGRGKLQNIQVLTLDLSHLEKYCGERILGLLGYEHIKDYETHINYRQERVSWMNNHNSTIHRIRGEALQCEFELIEHLPIITLHFESGTFRFALDTGSSVNLISKKLGQHLRQFGAKSGELTELGNLANESEVLSSIIIPSVDLGGLTKKDIVFHVADMSSVQEFLGSRVDGIIGYQFLKEHQVIINYKQQKMIFLD